MAHNPYRYRECGLDNIYLMNGVTFHDTPYGKGISIENIDGLHRVIGQFIIDSPEAISGAEFRFLRTEMEITQRRIAILLGTTEQTVRLWERHRKKSIPGLADRLMRILYNDHIGREDAPRYILDRLAELDLVEKGEMHLKETEDGWKPQGALCDVA